MFLLKLVDYEKLLVSSRTLHFRSLLFRIESFLCDPILITAKKVFFIKRKLVQMFHYRSEINNSNLYKCYFNNINFNLLEYKTSKL